MARKKQRTEHTPERRAEFLWNFAQEFSWKDCTLADAAKLLADCEGDSELAEFEIVCRQSDFETARARYPELIFRYPDLYVMNDTERAEFDRRIDERMKL